MGVLSLTLVAFGTALSTPVSDGDRYLAVQRTPQSIEIRDDVKGLKRTLPLACRPISISAAGVLLTDCTPEGATARQYAAVDLRSGRSSRFSVPEAVDSLSDHRAVRAGRVWVAEEVSGYHWGHRQYRHRHTGEVREADERGVAVDLDSPELTRPLCTPLSRYPQTVLPEWGDLPDDRWAPFDSYDGAVAVLSAGKVDAPYGLLWRCGSRTPQRIADTTRLTVGGGWATWLADGTAYLQRAVEGRRIKVRGKATSVVHTRRAVYTVRNGHVYRARFPAPR